MLVLRKVVSDRSKNTGFWARAFLFITLKPLAVPLWKLDSTFVTLIYRADEIFAKVRQAVLEIWYLMWIFESESVSEAKRSRSGARTSPRDVSVRENDLASFFSLKNHIACSIKYMFANLRYWKAEDPIDFSKIFR